MYQNNIKHHIAIVKRNGLMNNVVQMLKTHVLSCYCIKIQMYYPCLSAKY